MKANEFVKKYGIACFKIARNLPAFSRYKYTIIYSDEIDFSNEFIEKHKNYMFESIEIKRLVESYELVQSRGGIAQAKQELITLQKHEHITFGWVRVITLEKIDAMKQAIKDVESCL